MLLPDYLDSLPDSVITLFRQVEEDILEDMARRLLKAESITDTAQWQAWRLEQLGETRQTIRYHLQRLTGKTQAGPLLRRSNLPGSRPHPGESQ